jgi:8-oxo-dGTP pyrophosphatase MutT (NUDIX family)
VGAATVRAAGGVVRRRPEPGRTEVLVVHRPRYDDWSLPKGKLDRDERWEDAALREVEEETGLRCRLLEPIGETRYRDNKGRPKVVRYWLMETVNGDDASGFTANHEVDALRWCTPPEAVQLLTYDHDRALVDRLGDQ